MAQLDVDSMRLALEQARNSTSEDERIHPKVGAVVVKDARTVATAYRGEHPYPGDHAEFIALERKLSGDVLAGATVYTTLEPCTTRNHPNWPCAEWLITRKVSRVVIGTLDPNQAITGKGIQRLREANVVVELFPPALMAEAEEMNRHFARSQRDLAVVGTVLFGLPELTAQIEKLCLQATRNIRLFIHALGPKKARV